MSWHQGSQTIRSMVVAGEVQQVAPSRERADAPCDLPGCTRPAGPAVGPAAGTLRPDAPSPSTPSSTRLAIPLSSRLRTLLMTSLRRGRSSTLRHESSPRCRSSAEPRRHACGVMSGAVVVGPRRNYPNSSFSPAPVVSRANRTLWCIPCVERPQPEPYQGFVCRSPYRITRGPTPGKATDRDRRPQPGPRCSRTSCPRSSPWRRVWSLLSHSCGG